MAILDPSQWQKIEVGTVFLVSGDFSIRTDRGVSLYMDKGKIEVEGVEVEQWVPLGGGFSVYDGTAAYPFYMKAVQLTSNVTTNIWVRMPNSQPVVIDEAEEVFTNIDRMPDESGNVLVVRQALREIELARRAALAELRLERDLIEDPTLDDEPGPDPETGNGVG